MTVSALELLRDARATGETDAALDYLLEHGYGRKRAERACEPYMLLADRIAGRVEDYRVRLGLLPWDEWAKSVKDRLRPLVGERNIDDRASGRTTRAILTALARCELAGIRHVVVARRRRELEGYLRAMLDDIIRRLRLDVLVRAERHWANKELTTGGASYIVYSDHYDPGYP